MSGDEILTEVIPFETRDGSTTLYDRRREVLYRSQHGAISESRHVFLHHTGLVQRRGEWRVAELGFGAAVNFTQTVRAFRADDEVDRLVYRTVDWRPVTPDHLTFHDGEAGKMARRVLQGAHGGRGPVVDVESDDGAIELYLYVMGWNEVQWDEASVQAVFYDPFSRRINPEAWTAEAFSRAKTVMEDTARLSTYSAATPVKRAMFEGGLWVASAPGPGRKREMTVASPTLRALEGLEVLDRDRYLEQS